MILVEKYTGGWEDERQVHFMRCSHFEADVCLQLLAVKSSSSLLLHCFRSKLFVKTEKVLQSFKTFFFVGWRKRNWVSNRFMNIFPTFSYLGIPVCFVFSCFFSFCPSPTCFVFLEKVATFLPWTMSREKKREACVNYFIKLKHKTKNSTSFKAAELTLIKL